jgi:glycolate oxidase FAD binding subunit
LIERPESVEDAAALLRRLASEGLSVEPRGAGTKIGWGGSAPADAVLQTDRLAGILEHNEGDFTAVLQAGVPLAAAQARFSEAEQMFAVDPALAGGATIGGVVASGDSGPLRHRYGGVRDLVLGITVVLSDGTVASAGGKVIKNVAGYDLAKLFTGSLGTLGLIASVAVRLHPRPPVTATAVGLTEDPDRLAAAALGLAHTPLEADCLDAAWRHGAGRVLVRFGGAAAERQAEAAVARLREAGLQEVSAVGDDEELWDEQRAGQRSEAGAVLKVSGRPSDLARMVRAAYGAEGTLVARAALGLGWIALEGEDLVERVRSIRLVLAPRACTLLDAPDTVRSAVDPWPETDEGALEVMRRVKARFDPARIFRPGAFVGGI